MAEPTDATTDGQRESNADLLTELVAHLRNNRTQLRQEWARRIGEARLLTALTQEEIFSEATSVYDNYVEVLETGSVEALQDYARNLSERIIPRGVETEEVLGIVLLLRDVLARSLFEKYRPTSPRPRARRVRAGGEPDREHGGASTSCRSASASSASSRRRSASCRRRCCRCASGC